MIDYTECRECATKPGSPVLCATCLANRAAVAELNKRVRTLEEAIHIAIRMHNIGFSRDAIDWLDSFNRVGWEEKRKEEMG